MERLANDLKDSIIKFALEGKMTKRLEGDSSIQELLISIKNEKKELLVKYASKERKIDDFNGDEVLPLDVPEEWGLIRIGDLGIFKKGPFGSAITKSMFVPKGEHTIKIYEQKNAIQKDITLGNYYIKEDYYLEKMQSFTVYPNDIIVSCAGTIGETFIVPSELELGIINQALMKITMVESFNKEFFLYYFDLILKEQAKKESNGSAIKNIPSLDVLKNMIIPVPSLEEQRRIVNQIKTVLKKIEKYEQYEKSLTEINDNFKIDIKDSILNAAIHGKLTTQNSDDLSAFDLIKKLKETKISLIKSKKIKKDKTTEYTEEEPFDIPENWVWAKLGDIAQLRPGKTPPRAEPKWWGTSGDIPWVSISDMKEDSHIFETKEFISQKGFSDKFGGVYSPKGTLIMSFKLTIGRVSILDMDALHNEAIISIFPYLDEDNTIFNYLFKVLPFMTRYGDSTNAIKGATLNANSLCNLYIPLPPLEEQRRIVKVLNNAISLCTKLPN